MEVNIVIREPGRLKPDYSMLFELPELPRPGDYISVTRPDEPEPYSEDFVVRAVWWRLHHPETEAVTSKPKTGGLREIFVECEIAVGPYASDRWRKSVDHARVRGVSVEEFPIARFSVRQSDLPGG